MGGLNSDIKRMTVAEFRRLGYLQELNRRFLHPCGLALEVVAHEDGSESFGGVWDYRDDPEGITFGPLDAEDAARARAIDDEIARHADARIALLGAVIQPLDASAE